MPKPYYEHAGITIYCGDCREILPTLPKADLLLTDPPYGLGRRMSGGTWGNAQKYKDMFEWDVAPSEETFDLLRVCGYSVVIWGGNYFPLPPSRCWLVWDKQNAVPTTADVEMAWTNADRPAKRFSHPVGVHDLGHAAQKPIPLILWAMNLFPGGLVVDPYLGSGTTLEAAKKSGRHAIGIEIEERYCEIAAKRLSQEVFDFQAEETDHERSGTD